MVTKIRNKFRSLEFCYFFLLLSTVLGIPSTPAHQKIISKEPLELMRLSESKEDIFNGAGHKKLFWALTLYPTPKPHTHHHKGLKNEKFLDNGEHEGLLRNYEKNLWDTFMMGSVKSHKNLHLKNPREPTADPMDPGNFFGEPREFAQWLKELSEKEKNDQSENFNHFDNNESKDKRNGGSRLMWTCETEYGWRNLGRDFYPQFIRTANCSSASCSSDHFRCAPKLYTLKVLKKLEPFEVVDAAMAGKLPEGLRNSVKFVNVTTNICCECSVG